MLKLRIHTSALKDLQVIKDYDEINETKHRAELMSLIIQMESDHNLQDRLLDARSNEDKVSIMRWVAQYNEGNNLYRLKALTIEGFAASKYRIIYAYMMPGQTSTNAEIQVLAVVRRDQFNYEDDNEYTKRIISDYQGLF